MVTIDRLINAYFLQPQVVGKISSHVVMATASAASKCVMVVMTAVIDLMKQYNSVVSIVQYSAC